MFQRALTSVVAAAAVLLTATVAKADFVVDTFVNASPANPQTYSLGSADGSTYTATDVLPSGATRTITVVQNGATLFNGSTQGIYGTTIAGGLFQLNTGNVSTSAAYASLKYAYGSGQNLSGAGTDVIFTFLPLTTTAPFSVRLSDGTNVSTQVGVVNGSLSATTFNLAVSGFTGVNLANIRSIELFLNRNAIAGTSVPDADITVTNVKIGTPRDTGGPVVPAPPAVILLLAAAPALGLVRFARRKASL